MAHTFLIDAHLPGKFWIDAAYAATLVISQLPTPLFDGHSPYEIFFRKIPNYYFLRVFGRECFPTILSLQNKLAPQSKRCILLGIASNYKGYRCLDPIKGRVYVSWHVLFMKTFFLTLPYNRLRHNVIISLPL